MATTTFFEETLWDKERKSETIDLEFGRSSYYGENLIYLRVGERTVILDRSTGRRVCEAMDSVGRYCGYEDQLGTNHGASMFTEAEKELFEDEAISEVYKFISEFRFYVPVVDGIQQIRIRIEQAQDGQFYFKQSHYIKTPLQISSNVTSINSAATADLALEHAIDTIMSFYKNACDGGQKPSRTWFVENETY